MSDVFIFSAKRSAVGTFGGSLAQTTARQTLSTIFSAAIEASGISAEKLESAIIGNVIHTASEDPYLARACA